MMDASDMDEATPQTDPVPVATAPEAPPPPVFDATPWPVPPPRAPRPIRVSRPWGPRLWTATLAAALLVTAGGLAFMYLDDTSYQNTASRLNTENQGLNAQNKSLQSRLLTTQMSLTATLGELATVRSELEHPSLTIWNVPQEIKGPEYYLAGGAPDTFTYHLYATSNGPMSISILTLDQFATAYACVTNGAGSSNYCMHHNGAFHTWTEVTSVLYDFHAAEGCAGYVVVFTSAQDITVTPNISVTYNPSPTSTGDCAR